MVAAPWDLTEELQRGRDVLQASGLAQCDIQRTLGEVTCALIDAMDRATAAQERQIDQWGGWLNG
jgi:hypothetical protein